MSRRLVVAVALAALAHAAAAQDRVYRCGASYSHEPCASGAVVDVTDPRSAPQVAQARAVAQCDAHLADALALQRERAERAAARQGPALIGAPARVAHDAAACRSGSGCTRAEPSKRKREKADRVAQYRAIDAR